MDETPRLNGNDHDLLIRVDTKLGTITDEIRGLRDDSNRRLTKVEEGKLSREDFAAYKLEHEKDGEKTLKAIDDAIGALDSRSLKNEAKIDKLIIMATVGATLLGVLQFAAPLILRYFFHT